MNSNNESISKPNDILEKLIKLIPLLYVILVFISLLQMILFYRVFDISIAEYVDLGEVVVNVLPDTSYFVLLFLLLLSLIVLFQFSVIEGTGLKYRGKMTFMIAIGLMPALVFLMLFLRGSDMERRLLDGQFFGSLFFFVVAGLVIPGKLEGRVDVAWREFGVPVSIVFVFLGSLFANNVLTTIDVIESSVESPTSVHFKDIGKSSFVSDEKQLFLGKVKDYFFIYNVETGISTAIKMDDVESISRKSRNK